MTQVAGRDTLRAGSRTPLSDRGRLFAPSGKRAMRKGTAALAKPIFTRNRLATLVDRGRQFRLDRVAGTRVVLRS